jgi:hypothetical protein
MLIKWRTQIAVIIVLTIIALLAALLWKFNQPSLSTDPLSSQSHSTELSNQSTRGAASQDIATLGSQQTPINGGSDVSVRTAAVEIDSVTKRPNRHPTPQGILGGGNFRNLYASNNLTNIDYAWRRLMPICTMSLKQVRDRDKVLAKMSLSLAAGQKPTTEDPSRLSTGTASHQQQVAAFDRFYELCNKSLDGIPATSEELNRISALPDVRRFHAIDRVVNAQVIDFNNVQIKGALETIVTTPMYDTLQGVLYSKLDSSSLAGTYSAEQMDTLRGFAAQILVCRLGDDCGPDGYTTLFTCRLAGICGNNYEDAVWDHLKARNVDARAFRRFIDQRYQSLSLLDFSILKNSK